MLGWPGPYSQYHAANGQPHWITEMMVTGKEPFNAERLLLSTGIVNQYMDSNWENGRYAAVGHRVETPFMNMKYHTTRGRMIGGRSPFSHIGLRVVWYFMFMNGVSTRYPAAASRPLSPFESVS